MSWLVIVEAWEKNSMAESIFNAVGVRAVETLHNDPTNKANTKNEHSF